MKLELTAFAPVSRLNQGSGGDSGFNYATATTEQIKARVRFNAPEQNKYIEFLHEHIRQLAYDPANREKVIAIKQQIADVQASNPDPAAFDFNSRLSGESMWADQVLASMQMTEDYSTMSYDDIVRSIRSDRKHDNMGSYHTSVELRLEDIQKHISDGNLDAIDIPAFENLDNQVSRLRSEQYDPADENDRYFFEQVLPNLQDRILIIGDILDGPDKAIDR